MKKISFFRDKEDYIKIITNDDVVNVIGTKGSGKTTSTLKYLSSDNYIVINCDRLFELPSDEKEDKELAKIRDMLKEKYETIKIDKEFIKCYNDIIEYIFSKKKKCIIEGNVIQNISPELLKGKVIVKRTSIIKSYIRSVKRDYKNKYFMKLEKEKYKYLYKLTRLYKISKRRSNIFKQAQEIEEHFWFNKNKYVRLFDEEDLRKFLNIFEINIIEKRETVRFNHKKNYWIFVCKKIVGEVK